MSEVSLAVADFMAKQANKQAAQAELAQTGLSITEAASIKIPRPLQDRVLILEEEVESKIGDIYIPDNSAEKPQYGIVLAIGPGKYVNNQLVPVDLQCGNRVAFGKYSGTKLKVGTIEYLVLSEEEVIAEL